MDRYAQELLLPSDEPSPRTSNKQVLPQTPRPQNFKFPQGFCTLPQIITQKRLNLLQQQKQVEVDDDDASDTDYIPSDNEADVTPPKQTSQEQEPSQAQKNAPSVSISHPLKLNQRSLHLLDEKAMSKIGLFTENGELHHDAIKILEAERNYRAKDARNKQFRKKRTCCDNVFERRRAASSGSADLSDIKSESELEATQQETIVNYIKVHK